MHGPIKNIVKHLSEFGPPTADLARGRFLVNRARQIRCLGPRGPSGPWDALGRGVNSVIWGVGVIMYAIVYPVLVELPRDIFVGIMKACMGQNRNRVQNRSDFGPPPGPPTSGLVDLG